MSSTAEPTLSWMMLTMVVPLVFLVACDVLAAIGVFSRDDVT